MTTSSTPPRRHGGDPVGRPNIQPIAPTSAPGPRIADTVSTYDEPVFEYKKDKKPRKHIVRGVFIALGLILLALTLWFGYKTLTAASNILVKKIGVGAPALKGNVSVAQLKGEGDGRINILVLGEGGAGHEGPLLTDTIMVWSIDPKTKDVAMLSIPRDLYVQINNNSYGKINSANAVGNSANGNPALVEKVVTKVIGVPIHYYAVVDFSGFKQAVDAVGGVDINVTKALSDNMYPCDSENGKYCPIYFPVGMTHMNGTQALRYARSRETTSDFDRAARQQQVIVALRAKALSLSTLTNPVKISGLIDALGSHVKTDLSLSEIQKLAGYAKDIDPTKIVQKVLSTDEADALLIGGGNLIPGAGWIELPKLGNFNYRDIQDFVKNIFVDHYIVDENAVIEVQNGSGVPGVAGTIVTSLKAAHYNVGAPVNAATSFTKTVIYDYTGGKKPYTINYLQKRFGVKAVVVAAPSPAASPASGTASASPEIRIIIGSDYTSSSRN